MSQRTVDQNVLSIHNSTVIHRYIMYVLRVVQYHQADKNENIAQASVTTLSLVQK
jgi:hypothetical protein